MRSVLLLCLMICLAFQARADEQWMTLPRLQEVWHRDGIARNGVAGTDTYYALTDDKRAVLALDAATGLGRWQFELPPSKARVHDHSLLLLGDGVMVARGSDGEVEAIQLNRADGRVLWSRRLQAEGHGYAGLYSTGSLLIVVDQSEDEISLIALSSQDGSEQGRGAVEACAVAVVDTGEICAVCSEECWRFQGGKLKRLRRGTDSARGRKRKSLASTNADVLTLLGPVLQNVDRAEHHFRAATAQVVLEHADGVLYAYSRAHVGAPAAQLDDYRQAVAVLDHHRDPNAALAELGRTRAGLERLEQAITVETGRTQLAAIRAAAASKSPRYLGALRRVLARASDQPNEFQEEVLRRIVDAIAAVAERRAAEILFDYWQNHQQRLVPTHLRFDIRDQVMATVWRHSAERTWSECPDRKFPILSANAPLGTDGPGEAAFVDPEGQWAVLCQAHPDGKKQVGNRQVGDDPMRPYLILGSGLGTEVDDGGTVQEIPHSTLDPWPDQELKASDYELLPSAIARPGMGDGPFQWHHR